MSVLSDAQIIGLWLVSGGSISSAADALARALSESSGSTTVTSSNPDGGTNVGLWQLDTKGVGSGYTVQQLQNPYINAQITVKATNNGTNWAEWADEWQNFVGQATSAVSSFQSSAKGNLTSYAESLLTNVTTGGAGGKGNSANPPPKPNQTGGLSISTSGSDVPSWLSDIPGLGWLIGTASDVSDIATALQDGVNMFTLLFKPSLWFRVGAFFAGTILLAFGIWMLAKSAGFDPHIPTPSVMPVPLPV